MNWKSYKKSISKLSNKEKGDSFELLTKQYLKYDPKYATKLKYVWLLTEIPKNIHKKLNQFKPDLIAMCETESIWDLGEIILDEIKDYKVKNKVPVIVGGGLATFAPDLVAKNKYVDLVCVGEGENALVELCEKIQNKQDYSK